MKNILNIIAAIIFSTLFYKQAIGLNLLLFTLLTILILSISNIEVLKHQKNILIKIILYLITAISVFFYKSDLTITANILAFFTIVGSLSDNKASIYIIWLNGIYTSIVSVFSKYFDAVSVENNLVKKRNINLIYWTKIGVPILLVLIIFTYLSTSSKGL